MSMFDRSETVTLRHPFRVTAYLTPAKIAAVMACRKAGKLARTKGGWQGMAGSPIIYGVIVNDLCRDGIFEIATRKKDAHALLTPEGVDMERQFADDGRLDEATSGELVRGTVSPLRSLPPSPGREVSREGIDC